MSCFIFIVGFQKGWYALRQLGIYCGHSSFLLLLLFSFRLISAWICLTSSIYTLDLNHNDRVAYIFPAHVTALEVFLPWIVFAGRHVDSMVCIE